MFTHQLTDLQQQTIDRIKQDPAFTFDVAQFADCEKSRQDFIYITTDTNDCKKFIYKRINFSLLSDSIGKTERKLGVDSEGQITIFERHYRRLEDVDTYLFSTLAHTLYKQIAAIKTPAGSYTPEKYNPHVMQDYMSLRFSVPVTRKVSAKIFLDIHRSGNISYHLDSGNGIERDLYRSIDDVPLLAARQFHTQHIEPLIKKHNVPLYLQAKTIL